MTERKYIVVDATHTLVTHRQAQVLKLASQGYCIKGTARLLGIGAESVKEHRERVFKKMGVHNIMQACIVAREAGLI